MYPDPVFGRVCAFAAPWCKRTSLLLTWCFWSQVVQVLKADEPVLGAFQAAREASDKANPSLQLGLQHRPLSKQVHQLGISIKPHAAPGNAATQGPAAS